MFSAQRYLTDLIDHLVALAGAGRSSDRVRDQVEAAAAALAAAGLIEPSEVAGWGDRADGALVAGGFLERISLGGGAQLTVAAMARTDGTTAGPTPPRDEPLRFVREVPIGRELTLPDGQRLVLLSLTLWDRLFDLHSATPDDEGSRPWRVLGSHAAMRWDAVDDAGMRYQATRAGGNGRRVAVQFVPALREAAASLRLSLTAGTETLATTEIALR